MSLRKLLMNVVILSFPTFILGATAKTPAPTTFVEKSVSASYEKDPLSKSFIQIAKQATPAVVFIKVELGGNTQQPLLEEDDLFNPYSPFGDDLMRRFFGIPYNNKPATPQPQQGQGSGFFITEDGYIMTNAHVVKDATNIEVTLKDGRVLRATLVGKDIYTDIAIIKIEKEKDRYPYLEFGDSEALEVGEWVVAIGNPFQLKSSLSAGIVSAKGRQELEINRFEDFIQTDAAINPGNSGGPLLNLDGKVVGINTAIFSRGGGSVGIGFAVPSAMARQVIDPLIQTGTVTRGFLGIFLQPVDQKIAAAFNLPKAEGVLISGIEKDTPAEKGGLRQGDIILECNGKPIKSLPSFRYELASMKPGTQVTLKISRKGKILNLTVTLGSQERLASGGVSQKLGLEVETLTGEFAQQLGYKSVDSGVLITKVKAGSPAAQIGLRPGFLIQAVNHQKITCVEEYEAALEKTVGNNHILLLVRHGTISKFYSIKIE